MYRSPVLAICLSACLLKIGAPLAPAESSPIEVLAQSNEHIHRFTLQNGMIGIVKEDRSAPTMALQIWVGTGSIHEEQYLGAGLSHYVEHMIFKGTPTRGPGDISREIAEAGGRINAYTTLDRTVFHFTMPAANWKTGLDIISDAVMNAAMPEEEWEREQEVILREMAMGRDDPRRELSRLLWNTAYRIHPHRHPVIGYEEVFLQTTRDDLIAFFERHFTPGNMTIVVVGDVPALEAEQALREAFTDFKQKPRAPVVLPSEPRQLAPRLARKTGSYQVSRMAWAWHTVDLAHPDAAALDVLATVVGMGDSSRLVRDIRDRRQLVHGINAWSYTPLEPGLFGISASLDPDREEEVLEAMLEKIESWRTTPFSEHEIAKARRMVLVDALSELQTMRGQAHSLARGEYYAGDPRFSERYLSRVEQVTAEHLSEVVHRYLRPENRTTAILSPERPDAPRDRAEPVAVEPVERILLDNGIPLIVRTDPRLPFVHITVAMKGGLLSEREDNQGITMLMSELLTRGTTERTAAEIAETVESRGASFTAFSGLNSFGLQATCLSEDLDLLVDLIAESLRAPAFSEDEIERRRALQIATIRQQRERPFFLAEEGLRKTLYPDHPYRWTVTGAEESLNRLTGEAIRNHLERHRQTGNMAISIFGNITAEQAREAAARMAREVPEGPAPRYEHTVTLPELPARIRRREPKEQSIYLMGFAGVDIADPRADALNVLQTAMTGLDSELGMELREKRGLVYFSGAFHRPGLDPGPFVFYAGTHEKAVDYVEHLIDEQIERIVSEGLHEAEMKRAVEQVVAGYYEMLQDNAGLAQICALNELYGLGYNHLFTTEERIRSLTSDDIRDAAAFVLRPERRVTSVLLPLQTTPTEDSNHDGKQEE